MPTRKYHSVISIDGVERLARSDDFESDAAGSFLLSSGFLMEGGRARLKVSFRNKTVPYLMPSATDDVEAWKSTHTMDLKKNAPASFLLLLRAVFDG